MTSAFFAIKCKRKQTFYFALYLQTMEFIQNEKKKYWLDEHV